MSNSWDISFLGIAIQSGSIEGNSLRAGEASKNQKNMSCDDKDTGATMSRVL